MFLDGVINPEFVLLSQRVLSCSPFMVATVLVGTFLGGWCVLSFISGKNGGDNPGIAGPFRVLLIIVALFFIGLTEGPGRR
jgi:hypothetical protein